MSNYPRYPEQVQGSFTKEEVYAIIAALNFTKRRSKAWDGRDERCLRLMTILADLFEKEIKWEFPVSNSSDL